MYVTDNTPVERFLSLSVIQGKCGDGIATEVLRPYSKSSLTLSLNE
jgi:hypothetical protein